MKNNLQNVNSRFTLSALLACTAAISPVVSTSQAASVSLGPPAPAVTPAPVAPPRAASTTLGPPAPAAAPAQVAPAPAPAQVALVDSSATSAAPADLGQSTPVAALESTVSAPAPVTFSIPTVNIVIPRVHIAVPVINPALQTGARLGGFFRGVGAGFSQLVRPE